MRECDRELTDLGRNALALAATFTPGGAAADASGVERSGSDAKRETGARADAALSAVALARAEAELRLQTAARRVYIEPRAFCGPARSTGFTPYRPEKPAVADRAGSTVLQLGGSAAPAISMVDVRAFNAASSKTMTRSKADPASPRTEAGRRWAATMAPSLSDIEALAAEAFAALPTAFRQRCDGVAILVVDFPEDDVLEALAIDDAFNLLGLYQGVDLIQKENSATAPDIDRIFLYRRPLLDYWAEHEETLGDLVTHVLVHEIGHHFGLSDAEMEVIEAAAG